MLQTARHLLELIRFSHTLFALPFALLASLMAFVSRAHRTPAEPFRWQDLLGILLCMTFARSAAMAFNRLVDKNLDAQNARTRGRHLPSGILSVAMVTIFTVVCAAGFIASTLLFWPNPWPLYLSLPVLVFICGYSLAKRFTALVHFWLGAALLLAPICAWIAVAGFEGILSAVILGGAVMFWVAGFDMIYACQDDEADRRQGLYSVPAKFGIAGALRIAAICHAVTLLLLFALPFTFPELGLIYYVGVSLVTLLLIYEHAIVKPHDLSRVNIAFFRVNAVISLGLLLVGALDLWL